MITKAVVCFLKSATGWKHSCRYDRKKNSAGVIAKSLADVIAKKFLTIITVRDILRQTVDEE